MCGVEADQKQIRDGRHLARAIGGKQLAERTPLEIVDPLADGAGQIFHRIKGDYFSILGLPLLPLLAELRKQGVIPK